MNARAGPIHAATRILSKGAAGVWRDSLALEMVHAPLEQPKADVSSEVVVAQVEVCQRVKIIYRCRNVSREMVAADNQSFHMVQASNFGRKGALEAVVAKTHTHYISP
jgi:hypothetical protein